MKNKLIDIIDFKKINILLDGFNKTTGFVTAILDLEGNVLSKSGWRKICNEFHRIHPETSKNCKISDTEIAGKIGAGKKYHSYKCINGLIDVAVPIIIRGEHLANLFTGQFFFEQPDKEFFITQAAKYGFNENTYLEALEKVPVVSEEKVKIAIAFLVNVTEIIVEMSLQKLEQIDLSNALKKNEEHLRSVFNAMSEGFSIQEVICDESGKPCDLRFIDANPAFEIQTGLKNEEILGHTLLELFPTSEHYWIERFGNVGLTGDPISFEAKFGPLNDQYHVNAFQTKPGQFGTMFTNINERKIAEDKIKFQNKLLTQMGNLAKVGAWQIDAQTMQQEWSDETYNIYDADRATYKPDLKLEISRLIPTDKPIFKKSIEDAVRHGKSFDLELEIITVIGNHKIVRAIADVETEDGKPQKVIGALWDITERKKLEEEMKESLIREKLMADIVRESSIGIAIGYPDGKMGMANTAYQNITGYTEEELRNIDWNKTLTPPEWKEAEAAKLEELHKIKKPVQYEKQYLRKDGSKVPVELVVNPRFDENGEVSHYFAFVIDITERQLVEEAYRESTANLKSMIDNRADSIWSIDRDYNYILFNSTYEKIINNQYHIEVKKGMNALERLTNEEAKFWKTKFEAAFSGKNITFEFSHVLNGELYHFQTSLSPIFENNIVTGASGLSIDITERKQVEESILQNSKDLTALLEISQTLTTTLHLETVLQNIVDRALKLLDLDTGVIYLINGQNLFLRAAYPQIPPDFPEEFRQALLEDHPHIQESIATGMPVVIPDMETADLSPAEKAIKESRGIRSLLYIPLLLENRANGILIIGTQNEVHKFSEAEINLYRTISGQSAMAIYNSQLFEEVTKLNEELEDRVTKRTVELNESHAALLNLVEDLNEKSLDLDKNAKLLEAKNKELETFTYSVSHDLKAPLRGIDGYSKLLFDIYKPELNDEAQTFIKTIRSSTLQMNRLIDDLLDYSRLERSLLSREPIKIKDLITSVISLYEAELEAGNFKIAMTATNVEIVADRKGLTLSLRNLIENAIKFTRIKAEPLIQIEVRENDVSWIISVNDNGIGFDMKYHHKIFEIFQRLQRIEDFPGTGIGLAMVSKAMQRMNGKVWAESSPGIGSTFYLEIPKFQ
ncbi:MAG: PocR ligand-binding domain-containing protein [Lentimicrobium sp.]|jgi:PAS domain S-box-containing protein|nr:PocR ligand-binding domain-containing protein [Lentimicrobium sp.]